ncbi:MAG: carboxypeptidase-like regulatory domain-containing protein [Lutibacter sp.]
MNALRIKQLLTVWFALSLMQAQAQANKTKVQSPQKQSTTITEKVNNINGGMPNRISMNVTVPKQTQGATFGEKAKVGQPSSENTLIESASLRGVITGSITWNSETPEIATNKPAVSSVGNLAGGAGGGAAAASYASTGMVINPSTQGVVSAIFAREAGSGMATGRRQYQPVYLEGQENVCTDCIAKVSHNPYFKDNGMAGEMPEKNKMPKGVDDDCDGVEGLMVSLVNEQTGVVVASVKTERCGDFFFENLPKAPYIVKFGGEFLLKNSYDIAIEKNGTYDIAGELLSGNNHWIIKMNAGLAENPNGGEKVNAGLHAAGSALSQGASLLGGALPGGAVISAAVSSYSSGEPIPGIDVKLGKVSTELDITSKTNENGEFEFTGLNQGNYTLSSTLYFNIDGEIPINIFLSKKGYDYYKAQSDVNTTSKEVQENESENTANAKGKKGLNAVNVKMSKTDAEKIDKSVLTIAIRNLQDFKNSFSDLEKLFNEDKSKTSIGMPQVNNVRNRINQLENSLKNLGLLGKTAPALSDLDIKLNAMDRDFFALLEYMDQAGDQYSYVSNVLKTKHDTAKNSVGNIR